MTFTSIKQILAAAILAMLLGACGGSSSSSSTVADEGGIGGSGISQGTITDFGSIWVNGVEFETDDSAFTINGDDTATQSALRLGMVVTVTGTIEANGVSGTATRVVYARHLEGPVGSIVSANKLVIAGQTVFVDSATRFDGVADTTELNVGNVVQVSGFLDVNGQWHATYLGLTAESFVEGATEVEVKGLVTDLAGNTFVIGALSIDASNLDISGIRDGNYVKVKGFHFGGAGALIATEVDVESSELGVEDADEAELQGLITAVNSASEFMIGTQVVRIGDQTEFDGGIAADIRVGLQVEVEGSVTAGVFTADEIAFEDDVELEANVSAVDVVAGTLTLGGLDIVVSVIDGLTELDGISSLAEIQAGDHVQIRGRASAAGVEATTLDLDSESDTVVMRGTISELAGTVVTVLGTEIDLDSVGEGGDEIIAQARVGDAVELEGTLSDNVVNWESVELDD